MKSRVFNSQPANQPRTDFASDTTKAHGIICSNTGLIVRLLLVLRVALSATAMLLGSLPRLLVRLFVVAVRLLRVSMGLFKVALRLP